MVLPSIRSKMRQEKLRKSLNLLSSPLGFQDRKSARIELPRGRQDWNGISASELSSRDNSEETSHET
jgi:hypothetical protein